MADASRSVAEYPSVDSSTNASEVVDHAHHEIHEGDSFYVYITDSIGGGESIDITIITPNTAKWNHTLFVSSGSGAYTLFAYEGAVTDVAGTPFVPINRNRNSSKVSGTIARTGDTFTSDGNLAISFEVGAGNKSGTIFGARDELILKQNTQYLFRLTSVGAGNRVSLFVDWYGHQNK